MSDYLGPDMAGLHRLAVSLTQGRYTETTRVAWALLEAHTPVWIPPTPEAPFLEDRDWPGCYACEGCGPETDAPCLEWLAACLLAGMRGALHAAGVAEDALP